MEVDFRDIGGVLGVLRKEGLPDIEKQSRALDHIAQLIIRRGCTRVGLTDDIIAKGDTPLTTWINAQDRLAAAAQSAPSDPSSAQDLDDSSIRLDRDMSMGFSEFEGSQNGTGSEMRTALHDSLSEGSEDSTSSTPKVENFKSQDLIPSQQLGHSTTEISMHASKRRRISEKDAQMQEATRPATNIGTSSFSPPELSIEPQIDFSGGSGGARDTGSRHAHLEVSQWPRSLTPIELTVTRTCICLHMACRMERRIYSVKY